MEEKERISLETIQYMIQNNQFSMSEELAVFQTILDKYNLLPLGQYAKANNISDQTVLNRMKDKKQAFVIIGNTNFYF